MPCLVPPRLSDFFEGDTVYFYFSEPVKVGVPFNPLRRFGVEYLKPFSYSRFFLTVASLSVCCHNIDLNVQSPTLLGKQQALTFILTS